MNNLVSFVCNDDLQERTKLSKALEQWGYRPVIIDSIESAKEELQTNSKPEVIILQWSMKNIDAVSLCQTIRSKASLLDTYIFLTFPSPNSSSIEIAAGFAAGANDYIQEPVHLTVLKAKLRIAQQLSRMQSSLKSAFEENQRLVASIPSALIILGDTGKVVRWNARAQNIFMLSVTHVLGKTLPECGITWDWKQITNAMQESLESGEPTEVSNLEFHTAKKKGILDLSVSTLRTHTNTKSGFLILGTDVSERRKMELQLRQSQRLESIGHLAAGVAHEINTPTQYITDNVTFLKQAYNDISHLLNNFDILIIAAKNEGFRSDLQQIIYQHISEIDFHQLKDEIPSAIDQSLNGLSRITEIVRAMRTFSHPGGKEQQALDINNALESTITVSRNTWKYVADLQTNFSKDLPLLNCFPSDLNQVFLNLIVNSTDAIREAVGESPTQKGHITITTEKLLSSKDSNEWIQITISDTGAGIPQELHHRVFEPFFTTKPVGKGTGQGLAIAYNVIVEKHRGDISFESSLGKGTKFKIKLPI